MDLGTAGSIASLIGLAGLAPLAAAGVKAILEQKGGRRLLRLEGTHVDVVTTTSADSKSPIGPPVRRVTTGHGQVQGLAHCAEAIGRFYRRRPIRVFMSKQATNEPLIEDLVILGGLRGNELAEEFAAELNARRPGLIVFDDTPGVMTVGIPGCVIPNYDLAIDADGYARRDLALVVAWRNVRAGYLWRRSFMCVGLSSYGTAEAARWLFGSVIAVGSSCPSSRRDQTMRGFRGGLRRRDCCLAIIEMRYGAGPLPAVLGVPVIRHSVTVELPRDPQPVASAAGDISAGSPSSSATHGSR